jgi:uncharacterized tellurite resistance protein B-like protein
MRGEAMEQTRVFREGLRNVRDRVCAATTKDSAPAILGKLAPLAKDGTGHHLVELALYGDTLRLVAVAMAADSTLTDKERESLGSFLTDLLHNFSRYRRDYATFIPPKGADLVGAIRHYLADTKVFGFECRPTRMAGLAVCSNAERVGKAAGVESEYRRLLTAFIDFLAEAASGTDVRGRLLKEISAAGENPSGDNPLTITSQLPDLAKLRITCEAELFDELMAMPVVKEVMGSFDAVRKLSAARCAMLRDGVRVTPRILPKVMETVTRLRNVIGDEVPCEAYVFSEPNINAFVTLQGDVAIIGLSSAAVHQLTGPGELEFVLGHELGHVLFEHAKLGAGPLLKSGRLSVRQAMRVRAWERAAEISADRVGLHVCGALQNAVAAFFKLQAGVSLADHSFDIEEFSNQWDELASEITALGERDLWDCSHPVTPLRVRAMVTHWEAWNAASGPRDEALKTADESIRRMLAMMDPSEVCDQTAGSDIILAKFFFWGGLYVALADGELVEAERNRLAELAPPGVNVSESLKAAMASPDACLKQFKTDLDGRRRKLSALELFRIMSGVLDVACADERLSDAEKLRVHEVGELIGLHGVACDLVIDRYLNSARAAE